MVTNTIKDAEVDPVLIRLSLARILSSKHFETRPKLRRLLTFMVEAKLMGQTLLKAYTLGIEVFDRDITHDPQVDSIVRTSAVRLRGMLEAYYADEGKDDSIRVMLNKGSYLPTFFRVQGADVSLGKSPEHFFLAIEPLELIGEVSELEFLSTGIAEELLSNISSYGDNLVVAYVADSRYEQPGISSGLYQGSAIKYSLRSLLRATNEEIRISFKFVETESGIVHWCKTFFYSRLTSLDLFEIQDQVARKVIATLLDPHGVIYLSLKHKPPAFLGTYQAIFRYHQYQEAFTSDKHLSARVALERAVSEEPDYAHAWAALANVYLGEALFGFNQTANPSSLIKKVVCTAQKAVAFEPRNVMANYIFVMALFYSRDKEQFLAMAERALTLAPSRPDNLAVIGMHLMLAGKWEQGLKLVEKAMELNPYHPNWNYLVRSLYHIHQRNFDSALTSMSRFAAVDFFPFQINLAVIHGYLGNEEAARNCTTRMLEIWPDSGKRMKEILNFWFPFEDLAKVFWEGLLKAGFSMETESESRLGR